MRWGPGAHVFTLLSGLGNLGPLRRPGICLPQPVQLDERRVPGEAAFHEQTPGDHAGASNASAAVQVHDPARADGLAQAIEDLRHVPWICRDAVIGDGLVQVLDPQRQLA